MMDSVSGPLGSDSLVGDGLAHDPDLSNPQVAGQWLSVSQHIKNEFGAEPDTSLTSAQKQLLKGAVDFEAGYNSNNIGLMQQGAWAMWSSPE